MRRTKQNLQIHRRPGPTPSMHPLVFWPPGALDCFSFPVLPSTCVLLSYGATVGYSGARPYS